MKSVNISAMAPKRNFGLEESLIKRPSSGSANFVLMPSIKTSIAITANKFTLTETQR
jgi:hypothetical protein